MQAATATEDSDKAESIRDAATIIVVRDPSTDPRILMGQRGKSAIFLPKKFVFPGGAVDEEDGNVEAAEPVQEPCRTRLLRNASGTPPETIALTAIRELWEETGHVLGYPGVFHRPPPNWEGFAAAGHRPDTSALRFFFRAVTPPGRPRRFDARFFLADASRLAGHPDDMPKASDELSHLRWVSLQEARALDLAYITKLVLAQLAQHLPSLDAPPRVPFVRNDRLDAKVIWF